MRSRMRQRREVAHLKHELRARDLRVRQLETIIRSLCTKYAAPLPEALLPVRPPVQEERVCVKMEGDVEVETETDSGHSAEKARIPPLGMEVPEFVMDQELFGNLVDQMISTIPWS